MTPRNAHRLAWTIGTVSIGLMAVALAFMFVDRHVPLPNAAASARWNFANVLTIVVNMVPAVIGILLASRRPDHRIGWMFLGASIALAVNAFGTAYGVHALIAAPGSLPGGEFFAWIGSWTGLIPLGFLVFLFLLFPTGHLLSQRWRPVGWFVGVAITLLTTVFLVFATQNWTDPFANHQQSGSLLVQAMFFSLLLITIAAMAVSVASVVVRYRRSVGDERLQLKWFTTGAVLVLATFIPGFFTSITPPLVLVLQSVAFVFLASAIAIAVLKYRLYEIDRVIRRTVLYGLLTVILVSIYAALVVGVGSALGQTNDPLLIAGSTLLVAALFRPLRRRIQTFLDRRFARRRYDAAGILTAFSARLRDQVDLDDVQRLLQGVIAESVRPTQVGIWIKDDISIPSPRSTSVGRGWRA